ncbi:DNA helicase PcrA [Frankia sp. CNm7]|uniref:ATP-dependent DNA helicase n=1 Tax=Frankia nepalensis TaxID=1836974 RepID=A0A937UPF3_9ACTN|nr:DNA helicase PcrA [Frankia nepalensis]MBL7501657.1 DNA helicase PcrA [Frankia nepalensis]MBL7512585.1 DNA helicase PcrA [Frankia nepalensis]MBL7521422.1 DNA helicase PcrA [Frankia nepalensis]MBL7627210.1 DNA helicase PcrA [Frankia nepalensis]
MSTLFDDTTPGASGASYDPYDMFAPAVLAGASTSPSEPRRPSPRLDPDALLAELNPQQRAAVVHEGSPLLIVAGAGSGKTRVLTHRIAYLLAARKVHPGEILAITFTNKAANEMKERVGALVGGRARVMWVSTFHSACVRILRNESKRLGFGSSFSIYDAADAQRLITLVCRDLDLDAKRHPARGLAAQISTLKNELVDHETAQAKAASHHERTVAEVYALYQRRLREANALDFDDLIMTTVHLLQAFPDVAEHYHRRFRHVLVDEYQDTNHAQYSLIRELVGGAGAVSARPVIGGDDGHGDDGAGLPGPAELCVVGDADQSIYAFRGADIRNIVEFEEDFPNAKTVLLEQNYRSTQTILSAANAVIARNSQRKPKRLWSDAGDGAKIVGFVADNEHDEAAFVAEEVDKLTDDGHARPADVAVFYRTNAQSRVFEEIFIRVGLPYRVVGGVRFYERKEIRDLLAYLRVLANPTDTVNLRRILNVPRRGIGDRAEAMLSAFAERERIPFADALARVDEVPGLATRSAKAIREFAALLAELRETAAGDPVETIEAALERTGYLAELVAEDTIESQGRVENLQELVEVVREYVERFPEGTLAGFLEQVSLVADADQVPSDDGSDGVVTLMTLHSAKGLEFPVVFLTGLEDGVFPHLRTLGDPTQLEEERRLAYVGITRARQRLYLTRSLVRSAWGQPAYNPPSRFLTEVPEQLLDWRRLAPAPTGLSGGSSGGFGGGGFGGGAARGGGAAGGQRTSPAGSPFGQGRSRPASRPIPQLSVGDRVTHDTFGLGVVIATSGVAESSQAKIDFGEGTGTKDLLLRYAPVTKL